MLQPNILITIGGQTGDYAIFAALNNNHAIEHWRVSEDGNCVDTYCRLTKIFECPDYFFFEKLSSNAPCEHTYFESWKELNHTLNYDVELPFSNLYVAQQMYKEIPENSIMNYAILNSLRCWGYFPLSPSIQGYANVAAFGIDGCNSMLIGESINTDKLCFIVTGDLAFFYDMNALGIRHIKNNVRILLINNGGGAEFKIMTASWKEDVHVDKYISANGHNGNAKGWAENCGFAYLTASDKESFEKVKDTFVSENERPVLLEVFTNGDDEKEAINLLVGTNRMVSSMDRIKGCVKSILGERGVETVKKILKGSSVGHKDISINEANTTDIQPINYSGGVKMTLSFRLTRQMHAA